MTTVAKGITIPKRYCFNVKEFHNLERLFKEKRVELIEGDIIDMGTVSNNHVACLDSLNYLFFTIQMAKTANVRVQNPVRLNETSEPLPDVSILRFKEDFYRNTPPTAAEVLLLVEVADSASGLEYDNNIKVPLYARHGIPEVWLVDLTTNLVMVYCKPKSQSYTVVRQFRAGEQLLPSLLPRTSIAVSEVLGL